MPTAASAASSSAVSQKAAIAPRRASSSPLGDGDAGDDRHRRHGCRGGQPLAEDENGPGKGEQRLGELELAGAGVAITPGGPYFTAEPPAPHIRMSYAHTDGAGRLADAVSRLRGILD